jgi:UPF0042 nucleotide-binding protein
LSAARERPRILVITGLSGSGKTHVARALEDVGWFCVDNLPTALIPRFAELIGSSRNLRRSSLVVDLRERDFVRHFPRSYRQLRGRGVEASLLFLEAEERTLVRRFSETRRPHPLAVDEPVLEGIREERLALAPIRKMADLILDTTDYTVHQLRDYIREHYDVRDDSTALLVTVTSFGYKYGVPAEADLVFDVRFLPNPNFVAGLRRKTGLDPAVVRFLRRHRETGSFLARLMAFVGYLLPRYAREGKSYLTLAVGCTGGRHRSVMMAAEIGRRLAKEGWAVRVRHRDVKL